MNTATMGLGRRGRSMTKELPDGGDDETDVWAQSELGPTRLSRRLGPVGPRPNWESLTDSILGLL